MLAAMSEQRIIDVSGPDELRAILGEPMRRAVEKERTTLHPLDRQWLAASPFCLIATSAADGTCDVSSKGDPAGQLIHVVDDTTIAIPERPGNGRADGYHNVLSNPHVGIISLIPGRNETLRINGRARVVRDAPYFDQMVVKGHRPVLALHVEIEQIFLHCAKSFMRSKLWDAESWHPNAVPPNAQLVKETQVVAETLEELSAYYGPTYAERLYRTTPIAQAPPTS